VEKLHAILFEHHRVRSLTDHHVALLRCVHQQGKQGVIRPRFRLTLDCTPGCRIALNVPKQQYAV
jgi:hypothetical protein